MRWVRDVLLFHPDLACEATGRRRLTGGVFGARLAFNLSDATQAIGVRLRTPAGRQIVVVSTHWRASPIDNPAGRADAAGLADPAEGAAVLAEATAGRLAEAAGTAALTVALGGGAAGGGHPVLVMGCAAGHTQCLSTQEPPLRMCALTVFVQGLECNAGKRRGAAGHWTQLI